MDQVVIRLIDAGISKLEAEAYLAILTNGPISAGKTAKLTSNYRPNTYQAIERLKAKGLISEIQGSPRKYSALSPKHILTELDDKKKALEQIMPTLEAMKSTAIMTSSMRIIEGVNGWKHLLDEFIDSGKERFVYGIPKNASLLNDFFKEYHKKRAKKRLWLHQLFNFDARQRIKKTNMLPYTKSRYLSKELQQPVSTSICGDIVAFTIYEGNKITTIVIENSTIAKAHKKFFDFLWKQARHA
jgi:sugar-specific transcriptional regulator TrmB